MITYLCHAPDRATFLGVMNALLHPVDGKPLMSQDDDGNWVAHQDVKVAEIGEIKEVDPITEEVTKHVTGHHVNLSAIGPLERYLTGEITQEDGTVLPAVEQTDAEGNQKRAVERSRILALLGAMDQVPPADGVPAGEEGSSGMRILDETTINRQVLQQLPVGTNR